MLAKMWKKVLLAICIIACIYNIMYKLVNRHSLRVNLDSVNDGSVVFDFSSSKEEEKSDTVEGFVYNQNTNVIENTQPQQQIQEQQVVEEPVVEQQVQEQQYENQQEEQMTQEVLEESNGTTADDLFNYSDVISKIFSF